MRLYLRTAIGRYLDGRFTLEQAFGLKRAASGRASPPIANQQQIAAAVLRGYFEGAPNVLTAAARLIGIDKKTAFKYWQHHKIAAVVLEQRRLSTSDGNRLKRPSFWTPRETRVLQRLFARDYRKLVRAGIRFETR
jgi:hypothetical protein